MLDFKHNEELPYAFNIEPEERKMFRQMVDELCANDKLDPSVTWSLQRIWVDERFSDNMKAAGIFMLGYAYCVQEMMKGGDKDHWKKLF